MTWPRPPPAASSARVACAVSASRPTNRLSAPARASSRVRAPRAPTSCQTATGSARPFTLTSPSGLTSRKPSASRYVWTVMKIVSGVAVCSMRAARWVVSPTAV